MRTTPRSPRLLALPLALVLAAPLLPTTLLPAPPAARQDADHEESPLVQSMERMEAALKALRRFVRDPESRAGSLAALDDLQRGIVEAKTHAPPMAADLPEAERADFVLAYRRAMSEALSDAAALEQAVIDGDVERSKELWLRLSDREDAGHERFAPGG